tara:strand:- start:115 stop:483 length:369 start_codon:yes stop_codon:yes gene_type:complete
MSKKQETGRSRLTDNSKSVISHMFLGDMCSGLDNEDFNKLAEAEDWEVKVEINNIKMPLISADKFLDELWDRNYEDLLSEIAREMFDDKMGGIFDEMESFMEDAKEKLTDRFEESLRFIGNK